MHCPSWFVERLGMSSISSTSHNHLLCFAIILTLFQPAICHPATTASAIPARSTFPSTSPTPFVASATSYSSTSSPNLLSVYSALTSCWKRTMVGEVPVPPVLPEDSNNAGVINKHGTGRNSSAAVNQNLRIESLKGCLKLRALNALDVYLDRDVIHIVPGLRLVRFSREGEDGHVGENREGKSERQFPFNWRAAIIRRLLRVLRNHHLEISLNPHPHMEGRRRHHFMPMLVFGAITSSIIAIPMMFQFLSVLGGKALLLAKLALILTAIQGLKKVATSNFNYGLYNTPGHSPWQQYDRQYYMDMSLDYTPPPGSIYGAGAGTYAAASSAAAPFAEHLDHRLGNGNVIPERSYINVNSIPDYNQVLRPRSTAVTNVD